MNMQQMMAQAQKMQRELRKAQAELALKEFTVSKGGAVSVVVLGSKEIKKVEIDKDAFDPENKEMIEDLISMSINVFFTAVLVLYTAGQSSVRKLLTTSDFQRVQLNGHSALQFSSWVCLLLSLVDL